VTFRLDYILPTGSITTFWSSREQNEGRINNIDLDLSPLAGRSVRFVLTVLATGSPNNDRAIWSAPAIVRSSAVPPTPTETFTPTPPVNDWLTFTNPTYGFQFKYPKAAQIVDIQPNSAHMTLPFTAGTNLREKYMDVVAVEYSGTCSSSLGTSSMLESSESVTINGIPFIKETGGDGGAGHMHRWVAYSTPRDNICVSFNMVMHSTNPGNYPTPPPTYDEAAEAAVLAEIVPTFAWFPATPTPPVNDWLTFTNPTHGFQFKYPQAAQIIDTQTNYIRMTLPFIPGTNLVGKYMDVVNVEYSGTCKSSLGSYSILESSESVTINGIPFIKETGGDNAAGQIHRWVAYSTPRDNICVSFNMFMNSTNPGNYPTPPPTYDEAAEAAVLSEIVPTFAWLPATPTPTPLTLSGPYAVTHMWYGDGLPIYSGAGTGNSVVGTFPVDAVNVMRSGPSQFVDGFQWVEVQLPGGTGAGWVNSYYLTEYVTHETFCADTRIIPWINQLKQAVNQSNGENFASLVSPLHGVDVRLWKYSAPVNFTQTEARDIFTSSESYTWGGGPSGIPDVGTFANLIQPKLLDVLNAPDTEYYCDDPIKAFPLPDPWPLDYHGVHFYNLFKPPSAPDRFDYRTWFIGIEYINNQPTLYGMVTIVWEP